MKTPTSCLANLTMNSRTGTGTSRYFAAFGILCILIVAASLLTGCGSALVTTAHAQANMVCSVATLNGTYGFQRNGQTSAGPLTAIGTITFDGMGNATFQQTISRSGTFTVTPVQSSTYTVNADCTSTAIDTTGAVFAQQVVVHNGSEVLGISMTPGNNVAIHFERIADPQ
jgi:hypothetical protein